LRGLQYGDKRGPVAQLGRSEILERASGFYQIEHFNSEGETRWSGVRRDTRCVVWIGAKAKSPVSEIPAGPSWLSRNRGVRKSNAA